MYGVYKDQYFDKSIVSSSSGRAASPPAKTLVLPIVSPAAATDGKNSDQSDISPRTQPRQYYKDLMKATHTINEFSDANTEQQEKHCVPSISESAIKIIDTNLRAVDAFEAVKGQIERFSNSEFSLQTLYRKIDQLQDDFQRKTWESSSKIGNGSDHLREYNGSRREVLPSSTATMDVVASIKNVAVEEIRNHSVSDCHIL